MKNRETADADNGLSSGEANAVRGSKPDAKNVLPDLFDPVLVECSTLAFRLRGHERVSGREGIHAVVQEWHCVESGD